MMCRTCRSWMCPKCGMMTVCAQACVEEGYLPGSWDIYKYSLLCAITTRAYENDLRTNLLNIDSIMEEMIMNKLEFMSSKFGAINCHEAIVLGCDEFSGRPIDNLGSYAGMRHYLNPQIFAPLIQIKVLEYLVDIMRHSYLETQRKYDGRKPRGPRYFQLLICRLCKVKCRVKYCSLCNACICLSCGIMSACACDYGMAAYVGANEWYEHLNACYSDRFTDLLMSGSTERLPIVQTNEQCPLCLERLANGSYLEYGVGSLFIICFGCNRKYCTSTRRG